MTRQQYIAELSQLLFYMTPWDKAKVLDKYTKLFEDSENEAALFNELGSPMKLAVTLHRSYEATPEPTGEEAAEEAPAPVEEAPVEEAAPETAEAVEEVPVAEEAAPEAEEAPIQEEAPAEEAAPAEEVAEEVPVEEPEEDPSPEEAPVPAEEEEEAAEEVPEVAEEAVEEAPVQEEAAPEEEASALEAPVAEEAPKPLEIREPVGEKIFSEIYAAATDAHSAVVVEEAAAKQTVRKARYLFLIPYTILSVLIAIPVVTVLAFVNVVLFAGAIVCLCACLYLLILQLPAAVGLGNMLIYVGFAVIALTAALSLLGLGMWFAGAATAGFPRFLLEVARKHGYREVEVQ